MPGTYLLAAVIGFASLLAARPGRKPFGRVSLEWREIYLRRSIELLTQGEWA